MANTPNLNLEEPTHGSANWDTPLNGNFSKIDAGVILTAPLADQTISGHNLTDNQGTIRVTNTAGTPSDGVLGMVMSGAAQGQINYSEGAVATAIRFNTGGSIALNPSSVGADDGGHGVVINNSGLYIAGQFADGVGITVAAGNVQIAGAGLSSTVLALGSTGVEGIVSTQPPSGGGSYTVRSPASTVASVLSLPIGTGTLALEVGVPASAAAAGVAGSIAYDASFLYICTSLNTWKRVAIATW